MYKLQKYVGLTKRKYSNQYIKWEHISNNKESPKLIARVQLFDEMKNDYYFQKWVIFTSRNKSITFLLLCLHIQHRMRRSCIWNYRTIIRIKSKMSFLSIWFVYCHPRVVTFNLTVELLGDGIACTASRNDIQLLHAHHNLPACIHVHEI